MQALPSLTQRKAIATQRLLYNGWRLGKLRPGLIAIHLDRSTLIQLSHFSSDDDTCRRSIVPPKQPIQVVKRSGQLLCDASGEGSSADYRSAG